MLKTYPNLGKCFLRREELSTNHVHSLLTEIINSINLLTLNLISVAAFSVMMAFLKLFESSNDQELAANNIENEAKRCVLLGVKVPTVIDFADILNLKAVKYLQGVRFLSSYPLFYRKTRQYSISCHYSHQQMPKNSSRK